MIDYLLAFADEPTARTDPVVGAYFVPSTDNPPGNWRGDVCIPGVTASIISTGLVIDNQFRIVIALTQRDTSLDSSIALELIADRDQATAGMSIENFILYANLPFSTLETMQLSPTFAGSRYPFGST